MRKKVSKAELVRRLIHGKKPKRAAIKHYAPPGGLQPTGWPIFSKALACHPNQVAEARARSKRMGLGVEYTNDGICVIPDAAARKRVMRADLAFDRDAFS